MMLSATQLMIKKSVTNVNLFLQNVMHSIQDFSALLNNYKWKTSEMWSNPFSASRIYS